MKIKILFLILFLCTYEAYAQKTESKNVSFSNIGGFSGYTTFNLVYSQSSSTGVLTGNSTKLYITSWSELSSEDLSILSSKGISFSGGYEVKSFDRVGIEGRAYVIEPGNPPITHYATGSSKLALGKSLGDFTSPNFPEAAQSANKKWLKNHQKNLWEANSGVENVKVVELLISDFKSEINTILRQAKKEKEDKEKLEKQQQEQKLAEQKAKRDAEEREAREKEQQRFTSSSYSNNNSSSSSHSSTNNSSSGQKKQQNPYEDYRNGINEMNKSIDKVNQAQQNFHNQIDQQRAQYKAQREAEDARWEQEKLQKQLEEERVEQERLEEENRKREEENRKRAAEADYNRRYSAELSRKREIIKARKLLFEGDEWKLSPTFSLIAKNQEPLYLFFVEVDDDYYKLSDNSGFLAYNIQITINENPKMKISPLIEIKPRSNGEYLLSEEIITKIKKEFSLTAGGKIYEFHNWAKNKNECEANYSSFIERAKATDFTLNFIEYTPKQEGNSEYWDKTTQKPSTQQKTQTHTKDYWNSGSAPQKKQKTSNEDYWK